METIAVGNTNKSSERNINIAGVMFSEEDIEILRLLSVGKTYKEIAVLLDQVRGENGISYVKNRVSSKTHSASLLTRVGVESSKALVAWYIEKTRPERIAPVLVYGEMPWYRSSRTMPYILSGFFIAIVTGFAAFWTDPNLRATDWFLKLLLFVTPVVVLILGNIGALYLRIFKRTDSYRGDLSVDHIHVGLFLFAISEVLYFEYYHNSAIWLSYASYFFQVGVYIFFAKGLLKLEDLYPIEDSFIFHIPSARSLFVYSILPHWSVIVSSAVIVWIQWSHLSSIVAFAQLTLQIVRLSFGGYIFYIALGRALPGSRVEDWGLPTQNKKIHRAIMMICYGIFLFFFTNIGFIITTSLPDASVIAYTQGGLIDFLYAAALYLMGLGMLHIPPLEGEMPIDQTEDDEDNSGEKQLPHSDGEVTETA